MQTVAWVGALAIAGAAGCASGPKCEEVATSRCAGNAAQVCSSERRWEEVSDCSRVSSPGEDVSWVCCAVEVEPGVTTFGCAPPSACVKRGGEG